MDRHPVHIRRCHICGGVTESKLDRVSHCQHCGKSLAPFYYFDDTKLMVSSDKIESQIVVGEYRPVYGLTVFWESS